MTTYRFNTPINDYALQLGFLFLYQNSCFNTPINDYALQSQQKAEQEQASFNTPINDYALQLIAVRKKYGM